MAQLKPIAREAIPFALDRAQRYRLLNEPMEAESICRDVLAADPANKEAMVTLLLALTDQFETEYVTALGRAKEVLPRLASSYDRAYYEGIIHERWAKAEASKGVPVHLVAGWFRQAMRAYESAEALTTADNPDPALRYNTCARILERCEGPTAEEQSLTRDVDATDDETPQR
jgi:hypothetical protein